MTEDLVVATIDMKEIEEAVLAAAQGHPEKLVQMFALVTAELKAVAHIVSTADGVYREQIVTAERDAPTEVTCERIQDLRVSGKLKTLLFDMTYYTFWVSEQAKRNKAAIEKLLEHTDLHGDTPPTL